MKSVMDDSARKYDLNGWPEIRDNPITKVGVFDYMGYSISDDLEPNRVYKIYRPQEELESPDAINSFKLLPFTDDHEMLGDGMTPAEQKGVHGVIGEDVYFADGYLKANLKIFSKSLSDLISDGKKELSIGYRCLYEMTPGVYDGQRYDGIQRNLRGNHIALVQEGRAGHDVHVLDHLKITFDSRSAVMPEVNKEGVQNAKDEGEQFSLQSLKDEMQQLKGELASMRGEKQAADVEPDDFVKKAEVTDADKDDDKDDDKEDKEKGAMDAKLVAMQSEIESLKKNGFKHLMHEISRRDDLASKLSTHIGVFDHKEKTLQEVAEYGIKKLNLSAMAGHEESVLNGFLAGKSASGTVVVEDTKPEDSNLVDAYLKGVK